MDRKRSPGGPQRADSSLVDCCHQPAGRGLPNPFGWRQPSCLGPRPLLRSRRPSCPCGWLLERVPREAAVGGHVESGEAVAGPAPQFSRLNCQG